MRNKKLTTTLTTF